MMVFSELHGFYHVGGCDLDFGVSCFSLEAIVNLKSIESCDQIGERDRK
jgi:hypothetical protein